MRLAVPALATLAVLVAPLRAQTPPPTQTTRPVPTAAAAPVAMPEVNVTLRALSLADSRPLTGSAVRARFFVENQGARSADQLPWTLTYESGGARTVVANGTITLGSGSGQEIAATFAAPAAGEGMLVAELGLPSGVLRNTALTRRAQVQLFPQPRMTTAELTGSGYPSTAFFSDSLGANESGGVRANAAGTLGSVTGAPTCVNVINGANMTFALTCPLDVRKTPAAPSSVPIPYIGSGAASYTFFNSVTLRNGWVVESVEVRMESLPAMPVIGLSARYAILQQPSRGSTTPLVKLRVTVDEGQVATGRVVVKIRGPEGTSWR